MPAPPFKGMRAGCLLQAFWNMDLSLPPFFDCDECQAHLLGTTSCPVVTGRGAGGGVTPWGEGVRSNEVPCQ
jgi:hypothetical protein